MGDNIHFSCVSCHDPEVKPPHKCVQEYKEICEQFTPDQAAAQSDRFLECENLSCEWKCPVHNEILNW